MPASGTSSSTADRLEVRSWLNAISGIARQVNQQAPLRHVLDRIADMTCELAGYDFSAILIPNEDETELHIHGSSGLSAEYVAEVNERRPIRLGPTEQGEAPSSRSLHYRRPVGLRDIWEDASCAPWEAVAHDQGNRSLLSLPLLGSEQAVGVLNCYTREPREFTADDIVFMETIADQAALAIESATLRARERDTIDRLHAVNRELEQQRAVVQHSEEAQRTLITTVLEGRGLEGLAATVADLLQVAVVVDEADGTTLAAAGEVPDELDEWRRTVEAAEVIDDLDATGSADQVVARPSEVPDGWGALVVPVHLEHGRVARIWTFAGPQRPVGNADVRILEAASIVAALVLTQERVSQEVQWRVARELVDELLWRGDRIDQEAAVARGRHLGLDLDQTHVLMVVRSRDCGTSRSGPQDLRSRSLLSRLQSVVRDRGVGVAVPGRDGESILLWPVAGAAPVDEVARSLLRATPDGCRAVNVVVSSECRRLAEYPSAHESAKQALSLVEANDRDGQVLDVRGLGIHRVLLNSARPEELARFANDLLAPLEDYDEQRDGTLVPTLRAYLGARCSARATANELTVHANTVRYRLRRAAELLGMDLDDEEQRLAVSLALAIRDLIQR